GALLHARRAPAFVREARDQSLSLGGFQFGRPARVPARGHRPFAGHAGDRIPRGLDALPDRALGAASGTAARRGLVVLQLRRVHRDDARSDGPALAPPGHGDAARPAARAGHAGGSPVRTTPSGYRYPPLRSRGDQRAGPPADPSPPDAREALRPSTPRRGRARLRTPRALPHHPGTAREPGRRARGRGTRPAPSLVRLVGTPGSCASPLRAGMPATRGERMRPCAWTR